MNDQPKEPKGTALETIEHGKMRARDILVGTRGITFSNAGEIMAYANMMASSGAAVREVFRGNPGACLAVIDDSIRFAMSPYALARKAYFVNGQLAYEAQIVAAIIIGHAGLTKLPEYDFEGEGGDRKCTVTLTLRDQVIRHTSPVFAKIDPKNSPLWKSDPDQQLGYYTIRAAGRRHFPHTLAGVMDFDEAAAARTIEHIPETSGVMERLTKGGKTSDEGFDPDHAEREMNGGRNERAAVDGAKSEDQGHAADDKPTAEREQGAAESHETDTAGSENLSAEEQALIADLAGELATATTAIEVTAAWTTMAGSFEKASEAAKAKAKEKIDAKLAKIKETKPKGKKSK